MQAKYEHVEISSARGEIGPGFREHQPTIPGENRSGDLTCASPVPLPSSLCQPSFKNARTTQVSQQRQSEAHGGPQDVCERLLMEVKSHQQPQNEQSNMYSSHHGDDGRTTAWSHARFPEARLIEDMTSPLQSPSPILYFNFNQALLKNGGSGVATNRLSDGHRNRPLGANTVSYVQKELLRGGLHETQYAGISEQNRRSRRGLATDDEEGAAAGRKSQQAMFGDKKRVYSRKCFQLAGSSKNGQRKSDGKRTPLPVAESEQEVVLDPPGKEEPPVKI